MKRIETILCTVAVIMAVAIAAALPAWAAETPESHYYPVEVSEYMEGNSHRIKKVYQLSLGDDPSAIPTGDFERDGRVYSLLDMTRKDEVGVDTRKITQTVTAASDTDDMTKILQRLEADIEAADEEGYTGVLHLDHTTVNVTVDGYASKTKKLTATRNFPNLSDADVSLIPKTIQDGGRTLTLSDVKWADAYQTEGEDAVVRWSATATYTGSTTTKYATGYTVTADYTGEVSKTDCEVVTYTAVFGGVTVTPESEPPQESEPQEPEEPKESETPTPEISEQPEISEEPQPAPSIDWVRIIVTGVVILIVAAVGIFVLTKLKERK